MPKTVSTTSLFTTLKRAVSGSNAPSYTPQKLEKFIKNTKLSRPDLGSGRSQRLKEAMNKSSFEQKKVYEIFKKAKEEGILKNKSWTDSEKEFFNQAARQERIDKRQARTAAQAEQKNSTVNKPVAAQNQGVKKSLPADDKQAKQIQEDQKVKNIGVARDETAKAKRWREAALGNKAIRGEELVYEKLKEGYNKQQAATSGVMKSRGGALIEQKSTGLLNKAMEEEKDEKNSPKGSKSGQKGGGSVPAGQKSGGHQPVKLQGSAGIDQLTHRQEVAKGENLPGGVYHVDGLNNKESVSQSETPPAPRSASAPKDPDELNI